MLRCRRVIALAAAGLLAALLLSACDTGEGMDLRLFCQRYSALSGQARLEPTQFLARQLPEGWQYESYPGELWMLTATALPGGRVHTIAVTALPELSQQAFRRAAVQVLSAYCGVSGNAAERWLNEARAGELETLGWQKCEEAGFRLCYYANAAGRQLRVSELRSLPEEPLLPTLREPVSVSPEEIAPQFVPELTTRKNAMEDD